MTIVSGARHGRSALGNPARSRPNAQALAIALSLMAVGVPPAQAVDDAPARRFSIAYGLSFLNLPVGEASLVVERKGERYALELEAGLRGLAGFFLDGAGRAAVAGAMARNGAVTATFRVDSRYAGKPIAVMLDLAGGRVRSAAVEPPPAPRPDRVPVTPADLVGVVDPLTMLAIPLGTAALEPALCDRRIAVFDGATRADLVLSRGSVVAATEGAYRGPALDCRVRWVPIAGHRAHGPNVLRMAANDDLRVRFAPALDATLLLPVSIAVATGWGTVRIEATRWGGAAPPAPTADRASVKVRLPNAR